MELTKEEIKLVIDTFEHHKGNLESEWAVELGYKEEAFLNKLKEAISVTRSCELLKSEKCNMCNEEKDCQGHAVCEDCGGRSF